jgi:DNA-binding transcriptional MerR regulator
MNPTKDLLSIGDFAGMARLSIKALRLYDELSLLTPRHVDPGSGYRYYRADQIHPARMIRIMREMDMPLATIRQVLAAPPAEAETLVRDYLYMREQQVEHIRGEVESFIQLLKQERIPMSQEVSVKKLPVQQVVCITRRVKVNGLDAAIRTSLQTIRTLLKEQNITTSQPPFGIYCGPINEQEDGPIDICVPVSGKVMVKGEVQLKQLPAGNYASTMMTGKGCRFPAILKGYDAVVDWIRQNGYSPVGAPREVWVSRPGEEDQMEIAWMFE